MYLSVGIVFLLILVLASPLLWVAWWLVADLGQVVNELNGRPAHDFQGQQRRRAA